MHAMYSRSDGNGDPVAIEDYLAANLRRLLEKHRWNQRKLARALEVSDPTVSGWLSGTNWISRENANRIAEIFSVDAGELFQNPDSLKPKLSDELLQDIKIIRKNVDTLLKKS